MRRLLIALFGLSGCNSPEAIIQPTLHCTWEVKCDVIAWSLGIRPIGSYIMGQHANCHCKEGPPKPYAYEKGRV